MCGLEGGGSSKGKVWEGGGVRVGSEGIIESSTTFCLKEIAKYSILSLA